MPTQSSAKATASPVAPEPARIVIDWLKNPRTKNERDFVEFHKTNPRVYERLIELADRQLESTPNRIGLKKLFEDLRVCPSMQTDDPEFKLNNNYTAFYARLLSHDFLRFRTAIRLRARKNEARKEVRS